MIKKLMKFYKEELSFKVIISKRRTSKQKRFYYLITLYFMLIPLAMILSTSKGVVKYFSSIPILFFVIDLILLIRFDKGLINAHFKKGERISLEILESYKKEFKIKFKTVNDGLFKVRKEKFKIFIKEHKLNPNMEEFILSSLRHRETIELAVFIFLLSAYAIAISTISVKVLELILPIGKLYELKNIGLTILIIGIIGLVQIFPYFFTKGYFEAKFNSLRNLQELIEDLHLSKKKNS